VKNAEIRVPVKVAMKGALLRMPPQVYLADLKPLKVTGGLAFNPKTKSALQRDVRKPEEKAKSIAKEKERYKKAKTKWDPKAYGRLGEKEGGPILRVTGSATYAIRPEYKYFSCWSAYYPQSKIFIDGKLVRPDKIFIDGKPVHGDRDVVTIPAGAKTLKIEARDPHLHQAGFITKSPGVARATICVPGRDPSRLVPIAHRLGGERVGCRTVWAEAGKPMSIFLDSSSGDEDYWVYLVDQAKQPAPLDWVPQAELVEEVRSLERYDPKLETLDGFLKLWGGERCDHGKGSPAGLQSGAGTGDLSWQYAVPIERLRPVECPQSAGLPARMVESTQRHLSHSGNRSLPFRLHVWTRGLCALGRPIGRAVSGKNKRALLRH